MCTAGDECNNACCTLLVHAEDHPDGPPGPVLERIVALMQRTHKASELDLCELDSQAADS